MTGIERATGPLGPGLYVVATPIGNLGDLTFRALEVLKACDLILAEDTRVSAKLLSAYGVKKKVRRYDDHADGARREEILTDLAAGLRIALVSDAGTPLVSDPGYRLVREAARRGLEVIPVPGASAALAALAVSGLATDRFLFAGFTPARAAARREFLRELEPLRATLIFFETGPRLRESLGHMAEVFGPREAVVARELTKLHETVIRGTLDELAENPALERPKGEIVVLVSAAAARASAPEEVEAALVEALASSPPSAAAAEVARRFGVPKADLYKKALEIKAR